MSAASDLFEKNIAKAINALPGYKATRPSVSASFSDVLIQKGGKEYWLEVKMNHTDNLSNPRVFYEKGMWKTTYSTPAAKESVRLLNQSQETKKFLKAIASFSGIPFRSLSIPTTKSGLKVPGAVPLHVMKKYFDRPGVNRYIHEVKDYNIGKLVTQHYTIGKEAPAYYMQAADDFYLISTKNPLGLSKQIPVLGGQGNFRVRIATRSEFYEVQAEIKISKMNDSKFSAAHKSKKKNPFVR